MRRILKSSFWVMLGSTISKLLVFFATVIVVRILGKEGYGQLSIVRSSIQMFIELSAFGMGTTATKYIAQYRSSNPDKATNVYVVANTFALFMSISASILIFVISPYISEHMLNAPNTINDIRLGAIILFFSLMDGVQKETLAGFEDFQRIAYSSLFVGIIEFVLLSTGALLFGVKGAICGYGLSYCIALFYNSYYIQKHIKALGVDLFDTISKIKVNDYKIIYQFSLPIALTSWINMPCLWYVKTYLVNRCGFEEMATYDVSDQWRSQVLFIPAILSKVILPMLSNSVANSDKYSTIKTLKINMCMNGGVTFGIAMILAIFSPYILKLYGPEYSTYTPLIILAFAGAINSVSNVCGAFIFSVNKAWSVLKFNIVWAVSLLCISICLINDNMGATGLAIAYFTATIILTSLLLYKTYRSVRLL